MNISSSLSEKNVLTSRLGNVFLIGINRPSKRNCVNTETAQLLISAFDEFEKDDSLYVGILYGKDGNFCAGFDLSEVSSFESVNAETKDALSVADFGEKRRPMGPTHMMFSKPVIAAVSGYAVAGGLELALLCDLRVVEESANMGVFCRRFGVPLLDGGTVRLPHVVGFGRALDMILTGRAVNAREALAFGLANRVVPNGTALDEAIKLANSLCKFPQECMRADRRSTFYASFNAHSMEDALKYEWDHSNEVILKEAIHGASKFVSGVGRHGKFNLGDKPISSKL